MVEIFIRRESANTDVPDPCLLPDPEDKSDASL
jgi:hypothetical protein